MSKKDKERLKEYQKSSCMTKTLQKREIIITKKKKIIFFCT